MAARRNARHPKGRGVMDAFFSEVVADHLKKLDSILITLKRIDSYPLDGVDLSRMSVAKIELTNEIARFGKYAECAQPTIFQEAS
jgi:hypothetical protein